MAVQMPWANHDLRPFTHFALTHGFGTGCLTHHHRHRRVQALCLSKHISAQAQLAHHAEITGLKHLRLCCQFLLPFWIQRHEIKRPSKRRRARLMPCEKEDSDLIDHFFGGKCLPRDGIDRRHNLCRQVIWRCPSSNLIRARLRQLADQPAYARNTRARVTTKQPWDPARHRDQCRKVQDRLTALIGIECLKRLFCQMMLNRQ